MVSWHGDYHRWGTRYETETEYRGRSIADESRQEAGLAGYPGGRLIRQGDARREGKNHHILVAWLAEFRRGAKPPRSPRLAPRALPSWVWVHSRPVFRFMLPDGIIESGVEPTAQFTHVCGPR